MAMFNKIMRTTISANNPLINKNVLEQYLFRYKSSCDCDDDKKAPPSLPKIGCDNPSDPTLYDCRKYGHHLSKDNVNPEFEVIKDMPSGIFRSTQGEILGLGAAKCWCYQCPEYFSYHHMSFYDITVNLKKKRLTPPDSKRKPP